MQMVMDGYIGERDQWYMAARMLQVIKYSKC